jgi:ATP-dependent Clp protease ATP-binding subunit ClpA
VDPPLTHRAVDALSRAPGEALKFGHNYVGTEHVLLALYGDPESVAAKVLAEVGPDAGTAKAAVLEALAHQTT